MAQSEPEENSHRELVYDVELGQVELALDLDELPLKSSCTAFILCAVGGMFAIHRFYLDTCVSRALARRPPPRKDEPGSHVAAGSGARVRRQRRRHAGSGNWFPRERWSLRRDPTSPPFPPPPPPPSPSSRVAGMMR